MAVHVRELSYKNLMKNYDNLRLVSRNNVKITFKQFLHRSTLSPSVGLASDSDEAMERIYHINEAHFLAQQKKQEVAG